MTEPGSAATDAELADYYDEHRGRAVWREAEPVQRPDRLDITISVRFTSAEMATIRRRAQAAGLKPTAYIRRCVLAAEEPPIDRDRLSRTVAALARDVEDLRRAV